MVDASHAEAAVASPPTPPLVTLEKTLGAAEEGRGARHKSDGASTCSSEYSSEYYEDDEDDDEEEEDASDFDIDVNAGTKEHSGEEEGIVKLGDAINGIGGSNVYFSEVVKRELAVTGCATRAFPAPSTHQGSQSLPAAAAATAKHAGGDCDGAQVELRMEDSVMWNQVSSLSEQIFDLSSKLETFQTNIMAKFVLLEGRLQCLERAKCATTAATTTATSTAAKGGVTANAKGATQVAKASKDDGEVASIVDVAERCKRAQEFLQDLDS